MDSIKLGPREQQIVDLLLQGCDNAEIAKELKMARRTVKAHFNRLFLRFGITSGIKRVKLATLLYRRQKCQELVTLVENPLTPALDMEPESQVQEKAELLRSLQPASKTKTSPSQSEQQNTSSRTISVSSTTS